MCRFEWPLVPFDDPNSTERLKWRHIMPKASLVGTPSTFCQSKDLFWQQRNIEKSQDTQ